jgi:hypothetical protein
LYSNIAKESVFLYKLSREIGRADLFEVAAGVEEHVVWRWNTGKGRPEGA